MFYKKLTDKRKNLKAKLKTGYLIQTEKLNRTMLRKDITRWSYKLYKTPEIVNITVTRYIIDKLAEKYSVKKTKYTMKEYTSVKK